MKIIDKDNYHGAKQEEVSCDRQISSGGILSCFVEVALIGQSRSEKHLNNLEN